MNAPSRNEQIHLYVAGHLDGVALDDFEAALFEDPGLLRDVEAEQALRRGILKMPKPVDSVIALRRRSLPQWLSLAACLVMGAAISSLLTLVQGARTIQANVPMLTLETLRDPRDPPRQYYVPSEAQNILLQVPVTSIATDQYRLTIRDEQGRVSATVDGLRPSKVGVLNLLLPSSTVPPGSYIAQLERAKSGGFTDFAKIGFQIVSPASRAP